MVGKLLCTSLVCCKVGNLVSTGAVSIELGKLLTTNAASGKVYKLIISICAVYIEGGNFLSTRYSFWQGRRTSNFVSGNDSFSMLIKGIGKAKSHF